jgi:ferredoxin-nitrate reductase
MERQLDRISSKLLAEEVQLRDIQIYFDNEVSTVFETDSQNEIEIGLKVGESSPLTPSFTLLEPFQILKLPKKPVFPAVVVLMNQYLQSSNPNIYAIEK